mmetsp:Transcript_22076/g.46266  ORF Transcript_22076/g.46266 Transcript_22076/m.46266 type:complete len:218 (-) Transcript_22076:127-780(-)
MPVYTNQAAMTYMPPWLKGGNQVATLVLQASAASARLPPVAKSTRSAVRWLASISKKPTMRTAAAHNMSRPASSCFSPSQARHSGTSCRGARRHQTAPGTACIHSRSEPKRLYFRSRDEGPRSENNVSKMFRSHPSYWAEDPTHALPGKMKTQTTMKMLLKVSRSWRSASASRIGVLPSLLSPCARRARWTPTVDLESSRRRVRQLAERPAEAPTTT